MNDAELTRRALGGEVIGDGQQQIQLLADGWKHFETFVGFAATCRRENTYEWMCLMLDWLNGAVGRLDPEAWFDICGADHFVLRRREDDANTR
jgi:hypothetical protein